MLPVTRLESLAELAVELELRPPLPVLFETPALLVPLGRTVVYSVWVTYATPGIDEKTETDVEIGCIVV